MASSTVQTDPAGHSPDIDPKPESPPSKKDDVNSEADKQSTSVSSQNTSSGSTPRKISKNPKPLNGIASKLGYTPGITPRGKAGPTLRSDAYAFGSKVASTSSETAALPFLKDGIYTDTVLVVEGKRFYIHRSLLGYASEFFQRLFANAHAATGEKVSKIKPEVVIKDKSYSDFLELLAFYHPGVVRDLTEKTAIRLLPIAEEYEMLPLKKRCESVLVNYLKKNSSVFSSNSKGPPTQRFRRDNAPDILLKCTKAADKGNSKVVLEQCLKVFANPEIPLKDLKTNTEISDQIKAKIFETRVDTTSNKLSKVFGELEKEKHENHILKKQLSDRYHIIQKAGVRMSITTSDDDAAHPIPSSVPVLHTHHYHSHHRHNLAAEREKQNPLPSTKRNLRH